MKKYLLRLTKLEKEIIKDDKKLEILLHDDRSRIQMLTQRLNRRQSSYNAIISNRAVCEGIANMMHYMLTSVGVESQVIDCIDKNVKCTKIPYNERINHAAIKVKTGEDWYYYDPTWDLGRKKLKNFFKTKKEFSKNHTLTFREEEVKEPEIKEYTNKELNKKIKKVVKDQKSMIIEKEERINRNDNKLFRGLKKLYNKFGITREEIEVEKENIFNIRSNDKEMFSKQHQDLNNQKNKEKTIEREEI